jgi:hypothetical protein
MLVTYYSILKMDARYSPETLVDFRRRRRHYIPEDRTHPNHTSRTSNPTFISMFSSDLLLGFPVVSDSYPSAKIMAVRNVAEAGGQVSGWID